MSDIFVSVDDSVIIALGLVTPFARITSFGVLLCASARGMDERSVATRLRHLSYLAFLPVFSFHDVMHRYLSALT